MGRVRRGRVPLQWQPLPQLLYMLRLFSLRPCQDPAPPVPTPPPCVPVAADAFSGSDHLRFPSRVTKVGKGYIELERPVPWDLRTQWQARHRLTCPRSTTPWSLKALSRVHARTHRRAQQPRSGVCPLY